MSGLSTWTTCPNPKCNSERCELFTDYKPFDHSVYLCLDCGLSIYPNFVYLDLKELNEQRREKMEWTDPEDGDEYRFDPLTELPEQGELF